MSGQIVLQLFRIPACNLKHHYHHCALGHQSNHNPPTTLQSTLYKQQSNNTALPPPLVKLQSAGVHPMTSQSTGVHPTSSVQLLTYCSTTNLLFNLLVYTLVTLHPKHNNVCLLKMAVATVTSQKRCVETNILLDEGNCKLIVSTKGMSQFEVL